MSDSKKNFSVHFETLGCRLNQIESEAAAHFFSEAGFSVDMKAVTGNTCENHSVILCIVNTCTVTSKAEQKARRLIRLLLRKFPVAVILVTGCYAQLDGKDIEAIDPRIVVLPGSVKDALADIPKDFYESLKKSETEEETEDKWVPYPVEYVLYSLKEILCNRGIAHQKEAKSVFNGKIFTPVQSQLAIGKTANNYQSLFKLSTDTFFIHSRASIKIQDGCNSNCTYCRIHLARGKSVSLDAQSVLDRITTLEQRGQKEVVLTGVNLSQYRGSYGSDFCDLADLLRLILDKTDEIKIRISSLYPERVDQALAVQLQNPRIQPHFHLSIQSGSDGILRAMKRPYSREKIYKAVEILRQVKEDPFIACDIIAGFPGETDVDFEETVTMCKELNFAWIHVFPFSPRPGTPAYFMKQVPQSIVGERVKKLHTIALEQKVAYITQWTGRPLEAITEVNRQDRKTGKGDVSHAVTGNFIHVEVPGTLPERSLVSVIIEKPLPDRITRGDETEALGQIIY